MIHSHAKTAFSVAHLAIAACVALTCVTITVNICLTFLPPESRAAIVIPSGMCVGLLITLAFFLRPRLINNRGTENPTRLAQRPLLYFSATGFSAALLARFLFVGGSIAPNTAADLALSVIGLGAALSYPLGGLFGRLLFAVANLFAKD